MIDSFRGKYFFLSNFYPCTVKYEGHTYSSSEHAFQAHKAMNEEDRAYIAVASSPKEAKHRGKEIQCRSDWDVVRVQVMEKIVYCKFKQNQYLRDKLMATSDQKLVEGNWWKDTFWGVCDGQGLNILGLILMTLREIWKKSPEV